MHKLKKETPQGRLKRLDKYFKSRECLGTTSEFVNGTDSVVYLFAEKTTYENGSAWTHAQSVVVIPKWWLKVNIINKH